jgi:hypothetical protein
MSDLTAKEKAKKLKNIFQVLTNNEYIKYSKCFVRVKDFNFDETELFIDGIIVSDKAIHFDDTLYIPFDSNIEVVGITEIEFFNTITDIINKNKK